MNRIRAIVLSIPFGLLPLLALCSEPPEVAVARAREFAVAGNYPGAIFALKSFLREHPEDKNARLLLGQYQVEAEDGSAAEKELRRAASLGVAAEAILPSQARALVLQGKYDEVLELERPADLSPSGSAEFEAARAVAFAAQRRLDDAKTAIDAAVAAAPDAAWVRLAEARVLLALGAAGKAVERLQALLDADPGNGAAWSLLGRLDAARGDLAAAEAAYTKAIDQRRGGLADRFQRGIIRVLQGKLDAASEDADGLRELAPGAPPAHYLAGLVAYERKHFDVAAEHLEFAFTGDDRDLRTMTLLGAAHLQLGNTERALSLAERAFELAPESLPNRKMLAAMYLDEDQPERAEALLRATVSVAPEDSEVKNLLARSLIRQGKDDEAAELAPEFAAPGTSDSAARVQLRAGLALIAEGRKAEGLEALRLASRLVTADSQLSQRVVKTLLAADLSEDAIGTARRNAESNPDDPAAMNLLGVAYVEVGDNDEARAAFMRSLEITPGDAAASERLAWLAARDNDLAGARAFLEEAIRKHPDDAMLLYRLAELELWEGNPEQAGQLLERALAADPDSLTTRIALAKFHLVQQRPEAAIKVLAEVQQPVAAVFLTRGNAYLQLREFSDARVALEALRDLQPENPSTHFLLARVYAEQVDLEAAERALDRTLALAPDNAAAKLVKARLLITKQRFEEAEALLDGLDSDSDSDVPGFLGTRLFLERSRGNTAEELAYARQLYEKAPSSAAVLALAEAFRRSGEAESGAAALSAWWDDHRADTAVGLALSELYVQTGKTDQAVDVWREIIASEPNHTKALNNLAWYLRLSDPVAALEFAEKAYALSPQSVLVLDTYAEVLARNGKQGPALRAVDLAIEQGANSPALKLRRAEINHLLGHSDRALAELRALTAAELPAVIRERAQQLLAEIGG